MLLESVYAFGVSASRCDGECHAGCCCLLSKSIGPFQAVRGESSSYEVTLRFVHFRIVEFFNEKPPNPHAPEGGEDEDFDGMFRFAAGVSESLLSRHSVSSP